MLYLWKSAANREKLWFKPKYATLFGKSNDGFLMCQKEKTEKPDHHKTLIEKQKLHVQQKPLKKDPAKIFFKEKKPWKIFARFYFRKPHNANSMII